MSRGSDGSPPARVSRLADRIFDRFAPDETTVMIISAAVIGVIGGFGAILFRWMVQFFQGMAIGRGEDVVALLATVPWWKRVLLPVIGAIVVGPMVHWFAREAKGHGVPEVINAVVFKNGLIRPIVAAVKIVASAVTIALGGSVGREGPIIQIGAAMASTFGQWLRFSPQRMRTLVGCGAAAGIAATFNAPIAGAFFALEIILRDFAIVTFSPIIVASVLATAISRHFLGVNPAFPVPGFSIAAWTDFPAYAVMGAIVGLGSVLYVKSLYATEGFFDRLRFPEPLKPLLGAVPLGLLLIWFPQVYGIGYATNVEALGGQMGWQLMLLLFFVKLAAVDLTLGSGFSGGIFAPALFLGAMLGGAFGALLQPWLGVSVGAFTMVGMAAMVAAATRGPITAILILFEMTGEYSIILPLMLACIIGTLVSQGLMTDSIFTMKFALQGRRLNFGRESAILKSYHAQDVMEVNPPTLPEHYDFDKILKLFLGNRESHYFVVDAGGKLAGQVSIHDIKGLLHEDSLGKVVIAADICEPVEHVCYRHDDLEDCLLIFGDTDEQDLPVLESPRDPRMVGILPRQAIQEVYNREVLHKEVFGIKLAHEESGTRDTVNLPAAFRVQLVTPPRMCLGRSLRELDLRRRFNVEVLAFKRQGYSGPKYNELPDPERPITERDRLIVVGRVEDVERMLRTADPDIHQ